MDRRALFFSILFVPILVGCKFDRVNLVVSCPEADAIKSRLNQQQPGSVPLVYSLENDCHVLDRGDLVVVRSHQNLLVAKVIGLEGNDFRVQQFTDPKTRWKVETTTMWPWSHMEYSIELPKASVVPHIKSKQIQMNGKLQAGHYILSPIEGWLVRDYIFHNTVSEDAILGYVPSL